MQVVERDIETGLQLCREEKRHPEGRSATVWTVWLVSSNGRRLGIGNGDHGDEQSMRTVYNSKLVELRSK